VELGSAAWAADTAAETMAEGTATADVFEAALCAVAGVLELLAPDSFPDPVPVAVGGRS